MRNKTYCDIDIASLTPLLRNPRDLIMDFNSTPTTPSQSSMIVSRWQPPSERTQETKQIEISLLRKSVVEKVSGWANFRRWFKRIYYDVMSTIATTIRIRLKENKTCMYYGHVVKVEEWVGFLPKCADCGKTVTDISQLRTSLPKRPNEVPRRKQRGITRGTSFYFTPQAARNLPTEIKNAKQHSNPETE